MGACKIEIYFDGCTLGNGREGAKSGIGVVVIKDGIVAHEVSQAVIATTNQQCEWEAFLCALQLSHSGRKKYPDAEIKLYGDSKMVVNQINDEWQHEKFIKYYKVGIDFKDVVNLIEWIYRENKRKVDVVCNRAVGIEPQDIYNIEIRDVHLEHLIKLVGQEIGRCRKNGNADNQFLAEDIFGVLKSQQKRQDKAKS